MISLQGWLINARQHIWAFVLGTGLAFSALHWAGQPLIDYIILPQLGLIIVAVCPVFYFMKHPRKLDLGPKYIWIPMLVIVASIAARLIIDFSVYALAGAFYGVIMFGVYLLSRQLGRAIFLAFIPFVVIVAISCIVDGLRNPGVVTGGIITNYCASAGFMIFGTIVNKFKWQWVMATLVLVALFFGGALEALFAVGVLSIIVLARRDWGRKTLLPIGLLVVAVTLWGSLGHFAPLWGKYNIDVLFGMARGEIALTDDTVNKATTGRWVNIANRMSNIQPLGRGFWVTMPRTEAATEGYYEFSGLDEEPVHNVPLVIVDQIGPVAGLAWLFIVIFCLVKTKWKYAWSAVLILSVFDHFIWTQFAPYWWVLAGVSTSVAIKNDHIFTGKE